MPDLHCGLYCLLLILICAVGAEGQDSRRGDTSPDIDNPSSSCSCSSAITASVFITTIVVLILVTLWWCYFRHKGRKIATKPDPQALSREAYDNPYFQGDELDQPDGGQSRINAVSQSQPTQVSTSPCPSAKVKTTATNTTGTLERGKSTLERVINAVIGSGRTGSAKRTKDDSYTEPSRVTVPLQGHDFTGLGFTVHGNLKEGLYVKEVMSRGPASQSGQVVPGDRVIGFTVLTDHIVFEDALTILTYASPYPVLLHLEKGKGIFSGAVTQSSKSKLQSTSAPSLVLSHPSFKSQSQDDLHKIKTLDIEKLKIGTIVPCPSKGKALTAGIKAPSPGLKHELPKIITSRNVQRSAESRHSERAIDVPGVEVKSKINLPSLNLSTKSDDVKLNLDSSLDDKVELASVEVHRPMSSSFEMEAPRGSITLPTFNNSDLNIAAEAVGSNYDLEMQVPKFDKPDPKTKFGIKVFPDIGFPVRLNKKIDVDIEKGEGPIGFRERDPPDVTLENETNVKIENSSSLNLGVNVGASVIDLKNLLDGKDIDIDTSPNLNIEKYEKPKSESKFGFGLGFKGLSRDKDDDFEKIDTDGVNVVLPQVSVRPHVNKDSTTKDNSDSEEEGKKLKSKHGFRIGMPDINLPSFGRKGSAELEKESPDTRGDKVSDEVNKSKEFKIDLPGINLPSLCSSSGMKSKSPTEGSHTEDLSIKLETPDLTVPQVDVSTELKAEEYLPKHELNTGDLKGKVDLKGPEISKVPNIRMPSLGFQTKGLEDNEDSKEKDYVKKTKMKHGFKFGLPSFSLTSKSKPGKEETDSENESDNIIKEKHSNKEFSMEIPKVDIKLKDEKNKEPKVDETKSGSKFGLTMDAPPFSIKSSKSADHGANIKINSPSIPSVLETADLLEIKAIEIPDLGFESNLKSEMDITNFGADIKGPDVSIPSFDIKLKKEMTVNDSRESDEEVKSKKDKKKPKDKAGFNFKFPHFSHKGDKHSKETPSPEVEESVKGFEVGVSAVKPDINVDVEMPKVPPINIDLDAGVEPNLSSFSNEKHSKKHKFGINFKAPDLSMPSVYLRGKKKEDMPEINTKISTGSMSMKKPDLDINLDYKKIDQPDFLLNKDTFDIKLPSLDIDVKPESVDLSEVNVTKSELKGLSEDENSFNLKLRKPDISLPSFNLTGDAKVKDVENKADLNFGLDGLKISSPDLEIKTISPRNDVDIDGPDFEIPSLKMDPKLILDKDESDAVNEKYKFDFKINLPEFKLPKFGSSVDSTEISDIGEFDVRGKTPKHDMPDFKILSNTNVEVPTLSVSDAALNTDADDNLKSEKGKKKKDFGFNMNLPSFGIKDEDGRKIKAGYSLPDELKSEVGKEYRGDFEVSFDNPDLISQEFTIPTLSSPDLGFEDDKSKSGKAENSDSDGKNDFGFTAMLPDLTMPKFTSKGKVQTGYEDETSNKNISLDSNLPDIDTEFVDDDTSDELNITDATKKKRFGFKIKGPELTMPDFLKRLGSDDSNAKVAMEGNQSDEVKSLNLKLKTPSLHQPEAAGSSKSDYDRMNENEEENIRVKLPRVNLPGFSSKLIVDGPNLDKSIGDSGYSDQGDKLCETDLPSPKFSSEAKLFGMGLPTKKYNESDEWKIKGISGVKMPSINFKVNSNDECPEDDREQMKYELTKRDIDFNVDDTDFVIPDIKTFSRNIPTLEMNTETLHMKTNKLQATSEQSESNIPSFNLNLKGPHFQEERDPEDFMISGSKFTKFGRDTLNVNDIDVSLDSSSLEMESDLPEADSDLQRASLEFSNEASLKDNTVSSVKVGNIFGNAFGFQGFKKHIEISGLDSSISADLPPDLEANEDGFNLMKVEPTAETVNSAMLKEDLPEADFHFNSKEISHSIHSLPEGDQSIGFSIKQRLDVFEKNLSTNNIEASDSESDAETSKFEERDNIEKKTIKINSEETKNNNERKLSVEDDDGKGKGKGKIGIGFGFKGFGKSSDSEECEIPKKLAAEPEGDFVEGKERPRKKAKKTFSFKAFGRSSSDTDEENIEKVSDKPMVNVEQEEKVKLRNKNSLTFGFKHRNSRNSESDDNGDGDKVGTHPQTEGGNKKQKMIFGFMGKSKISELEHSAQPENSQEKQDFDEETKIKPKAATVITSRGSKEIKYDTRSESEGGEDEKMSMDSRGEDSRAKSRYGLNFGFRKNQGRTSSDSEGGENDERRVNLNERGSSDKKESKGKSLKLGFKGLKNLKGKIQSEINKMRHDSPSSDDDLNSRDDEESSHGEKRKKVSKKKEKEKRIHETEGAYLDTSEEATIASAALAVKDNRRSRMERKSSSSSSSSSSDSSSGDEKKSLDVKKKKKFKSKRKEEIKIIPDDAMDVKAASNDELMEVEERVSSTQRNIPIKLPTLLSEPAHVTIVSSESINGNELPTNQDTVKQSMEVQSSPRRYVVVREMKLKQSPLQAELGKEVIEVVERTKRHREIPPPVFLREKTNFKMDAEASGAFWGSDSDMEKSQLNNGVDLSDAEGNHTVSGKQRSLTDSEELKRRAASLGDLSRLHEGSGGNGILLERAVSLDFKNASIGHPALHIRRLQLPDSSATSIDEADEPLSSSSPKKLELAGGLKAASQWGTLEEALRLGINSNENLPKGSSSESSSIITTTVVKTEDPNIGGPISNIEISGDRGPSVTALSISNNWNDSFEDEKPPSLPSSPIPIARTTITVKEEVPSMLQNTRTNDSNIVILGGNERFQNKNNIRNVNVEMSPAFNDMMESLISTGTDGFYLKKSEEADRFQQGDDSGIVTVTMIPADTYSTTVIQNPPPVPPKPKTSRPLSTPPELISYENVMETPIVTVSHGRMHENGEVVIETSDHNLSDEFVTPDSTPQKSMTQITLEGDGGYTVTEGPYSRTVIISTPDSLSPVSIVQTDASLPYLE